MHFSNDTYRFIWEIDEERKAVVVLLIGKKQRHRDTIYDLPRPRWPPEQG